VKIFLFCKFAGRHGFAAGNAGQVRDDAFDFVQTPIFQIGAGGFG